MMRLLRGLVVFVCVLLAGIAWLARTEPAAQGLFVAIDALFAPDAYARAGAPPPAEGQWSSAPGGGSPFAPFRGRSDETAADGPRDFTNRGFNPAPTFTPLP